MAELKFVLYSAWSRRLQIERLSLLHAFGFMLFQSVAISFLFFMPLWAHAITLRFLQRKVSVQSKSRQYHLADFMILMGLMSVGTALGTYAKIDRNTENWILMVSLNLLLGLMWFKCNQLMWKNGISDNWSRIAMQVFTYPSSILSLSFFLFSGLSVLIGTFASFAPDYDDPVARELPNNLFCLVVAGSWIYLTRRSFSLILSRNPEPDLG